MTCNVPEDATLILSLREMRLIFERLVHVERPLPGMVQSLRDCAVYSALLGAGGIAGLERNLAALAWPASSRLAAEESGPSGVRVDAAGLHAWLVAEAALDLAAAQLRREAGASVRLAVTNVAAPEELAVIAGFAEAQGLVATPTAEGFDIARAPQGRETLFGRLRRDGFPCAAALWWPLYRKSALALAPDSYESRRHAGTIIVAETGEVIGRTDEDETDLSLLTAAPEKVLQ